MKLKNPPRHEDYCLKSGYHADPKLSDKYLVSAYESCFTVFNALGFEKQDNRNGLIIVSGSTNSLKTKLALGLVNMLLEKQMKEWLAVLRKSESHTWSPAKTRSSNTLSN